MIEHNDLLDEIKLPPEKSKLYMALMYVSAIYMLLVIFTFGIDYETLSIIREPVDWIFFIVFLLPALGGFLACAGRSFAGWIINLLYYTAISGFVITAFTKDLFRGGVTSDYLAESYRLFVILLPPPVILFLLWAKSVRRYLSISSLLFTVGLIVSLLVGIGMAIGALLA